MVHHVHSPTARDTEDPRRNRINAAIERLSLIGVRELVAVSQSLERYLREEVGYEDRRITVIPNGVPARTAALLARPWPDTWVIGAVALFRPRKGLATLLEAVQELRRRGRSLRLRVVGPFETSGHEDDIRAKADALGLSDVIDWVGYAQDVDAEFCQMDVFALPSLYGEGMPMVVLEAMAHGLPVVGSDIEGVPEVLTAGREGLLVPPADPARLANALDDIISSPQRWQTMREAAHERHAEQFSETAMASRVAVVYDRILARQHRA